MANAFAGLGFTREAPSVHEFPIEMFLPGSDLTPLKENADKAVYGLTRWQPTQKRAKLEVPQPLAVGGKDYEDAFAHMNTLFLKNLWGDGLPILPPTPERVKWLLTGTDLTAETVVGKIGPSGRIATAETIAVALAMAGGRPEYLPVLIASVEAMLNPASVEFRWNATTNSCYPAVIVNGPIAKEIRLNSGYGCLGPSSEYPAGASIGRALRFLLLNVGGGVPGRGSMAIYGGAERYTNAVFAEDEDGLPADWSPLNVDRGFPRGSNTVTLLEVSSANNIGGVRYGTAEVAQNTLDRYAKYIQVPNRNVWSSTMVPDGTPGIALIAGSVARGLSQLGWSKEKVKAYLWERSKIPEFPAIRKDLETYARGGKIPARLIQFPMPWALGPQNMMVVAAGGEQGGHGYWMQVGYGGRPVSTAIKLPRNWSQLLAEAEKALGPLPQRQS